jgi:hypothetical protein
MTARSGPVKGKKPGAANSKGSTADAAKVTSAAPAGTKTLRSTGRLTEILVAAQQPRARARKLPTTGLVRPAAMLNVVALTIEAAAGSLPRLGLLRWRARISMAARPNASPASVGSCPMATSTTVEAAKYHENTLPPPTAGATTRSQQKAAPAADMTAIGQLPNHPAARGYNKL